MITDMKQYGLTDRILVLASMYPELTVGESYHRKIWEKSKNKI